MTATIIVEDGTMIPGANSYVSTSTLASFASDRGITIAGTKEDLLVKSMDYIESLGFIGIKRTRLQSLEWPRVGAVIDGYYVNADTIPQRLKDGLCHCAIAIDQGNDPLQDLQRKTIREKVDTLEVEYSQGSSTNIWNRRMYALLWKLLDGNNGSVVRIGKG